jgi:hypothetical protein
MTSHLFWALVLVQMVVVAFDSIYSRIMRSAASITRASSPAKHPRPARHRHHADRTAGGLWLVGSGGHLRSLRIFADQVLPHVRDI